MNKEDEMSKPLVFWQYLTFRDVIILALIVSNIVFWFKLKDYSQIKQAALNGNAAAVYLNNLIQAQQTQKK